MNKIFFNKFKLYKDDCLMCFFWRDSQMKCDYLLFGDLLVFDTTYRTNHYEIICIKGVVKIFLAQVKPPMA